MPNLHAQPVFNHGRIALHGGVQDSDGATAFNTRPYARLEEVGNLVVHAEIVQVVVKHGGLQHVNNGFLMDVPFERRRIN
jgi:hypothetical protein